MLVLTRKKEQRIQIGENVSITVLQIKGSSVRLGIEAPGEVRVLRAELQQASHESAEGQSPEDRAASMRERCAAGSGGPSEELAGSDDNPAVTARGAASQRDRRYDSARQPASVPNRAPSSRATSLRMRMMARPALLDATGVAAMPSAPRPR